MADSCCHKREPVSTPFGTDRRPQADTATRQVRMPDHHPSGTTQLETAPGVEPSGRHPVPTARPEHDPGPARTTPGEAPSPPPGPWSLPSRLLLRTAAFVPACAITWHLGTIFLYNAPAN